MKSSWMRRCHGLRHAVGLVLLSGLVSSASGDPVQPPVRPVVAGETVPTPAPAVSPGAEAAVTPVFPAARRAARQARPLYAGLVFGGGSLSGRDYDGFGTLGLSLGGYLRPRVRIDGMVTLDGLEFKQPGAISDAFTEAGEMSLDVTLRYDLTRGIYPLAGMGVGTMFWDYTKPVTVIEEGAPRAVGYDGIFYGSIFGGAGMTLLSTRYLTLGSSLTGGVRLYGGSMGSGLKNDLLKATGFTKFLLEVNCRIH